MAKAANKTTAKKRKPKCAALAMAKLIGANYDLGTRYDVLACKQRNAVDKGLVFDRAEEAAFRTAELGLVALALAPVSSLEGAVAKMIVAHEEIEKELDLAETDVYRENEAKFRSRLLLQDAMNFLERAHGITPESIGMRVTYARHLEPQMALTNARVDEIKLKKTAA